MRLAVLFLLLQPALCVAQAPSVPPLVSDRPGFGESSSVVGPGTIQLESGLTVEQTDSATRQLRVPQLLARVGVAPRLELRLSTDGLVAESILTAGSRLRAYGRSDAEFAGKVKVIDAARGGLDLAVIPYVSLPTASRGFGSAHYDPGVEVAAARDLPRGFGVSSTFNAADVSGGRARAWQRELSVSLGHAVGAAVGAYGEVDGAFVSGGRCDCSVDGGITVAVGGDRQFDLEAGRGVHGAAQDWFVGVGLVVRHRHR